jgi:hypothetical protein
MQLGGDCHGRPGNLDLHPGVKHLLHPSAYLLNHLHVYRAPVKLKTGPWSPVQVQSALAQGSHQSLQQHLKVLQTEMFDMVRAGQ